MKKIILTLSIILATVFLISVAARPAIYIGGLLFLEIINPRTVFFTGHPDKVWENGFEVSVNLECNLIYERNIRMHFDPELLIPEKYDTIQGTVFFKLMEDGKTYEKNILLTKDRGIAKNHRDNTIRSVGLVIFPEYPVLGGFECKEQHVYLRVDELNFDPTLYQITLTISRIGADG